MSRLNVLLAFLLSLICVPMLRPQSADLPPGPLQAKMKTACLECHDARIIVQQRLGRAAWTKEVDKMIKWGAVVDPGDRDAVIEYLSQNFPAEKEPYVAPRTERAKRKVKAVNRREPRLGKRKTRLPANCQQPGS
jgi:hypothetical protein